MKNVNAKSVRFVRKLRLKYQDQGLAFDALLYRLLDQDRDMDGDVQDRVRKAIAFLSSPEGAEFYAQVRSVLDPDRIYDFDEERAAKAKNTCGTTPELLLQELKRISS